MQCDLLRRSLVVFFYLWLNSVAKTQCYTNIKGQIRDIETTEANKRLLRTICHIYFKKIKKIRLWTVFNCFILPPSQASHLTKRKDNKFHYFNPNFTEHTAWKWSRKTTTWCTLEHDRKSKILIMVCIPVLIMINSALCWLELLNLLLASNHVQFICF